MKTKWLVRAAATAAMVMVLSGTAFAFQAAMTPVAVADIKVPVGEAPWWKGVLNGFLAGVIAVFYGYAKNKDPKTGEMEGFDIKYAFPTLIVGGVIGIISVLVKMSPQDLATALATSPIYGALVFAAEALLKAVFRHSVPWIRDAIGTLKGAPANPTPPAPPPQ
jgi:hypothetical protein